MTIDQMLASDNLIIWAAGLAGAAAMAAADWRSPWRAAQHFVVGSLASIFATPVIFPMLSKVMSFISVPEAQQGMSSGFMTGAFAIYLFEYFLALWRAKTASSSQSQKSNKGKGND